MHLNIFNGSFEAASYVLPNNIGSDNPDLKELKQFLNMVTEKDEAQDTLLRNFNKGNFTITDQDNLIYSGFIDTTPVEMSVLSSDLDEDTLNAARSIAEIKKVKRDLEELKETRDELADFIQQHLDQMKVLEQQVTDKTAEYDEACAAIKALIGGL